MKKLNKKGFTIVELVIVIAVIAILAAVLIPTYSSVVDKANASKALQEAKNAYTNVLVTVLEDGVVDTTEQAGVTYGDYTFKFTTEGVLSEVTSSSSGYTYTVTDGTITKATKSAS